MATKQLNKKWFILGFVGVAILTLATWMLLQGKQALKGDLVQTGTTTTYTLVVPSSVTGGFTGFDGTFTYTGTANCTGGKPIVASSTVNFGTPPRLVIYGLQVKAGATIANFTCTGVGTASIAGTYSDSAFTDHPNFTLASAVNIGSTPTNLPDLAALYHVTTITPATVTTGQSVTFSSMITNNGWCDSDPNGSSCTNNPISNIGTAANFSNSFVVYAQNQSTIIATVVDPNQISSLASGVGVSAPVSTSYSFSTPGTYYVRVCANWDGNISHSISESDSMLQNNCGDMRAVTVTAAPSITCGTPVTYNGESYTTVGINTKCWFQKNLNTTQYADGTNITPWNVDLQTPTNPLNDYVTYQQDPACMWVSKNDAYADNKSFIFYTPAFNGGKFYNWLAVDNSRHLCPTGWHVSTDADWTDMETSQGTDIAYKLKATGATYWNNNTEATNTSGLTAYGSGGFANNGWKFFGNDGFWWTSTESNTCNATMRYMLNTSMGSVTNMATNKSAFYSVRCVSDTDMTPAPVVSVSIAPTTASVATTATRQFTASVVGSSTDKTVIWSVVETGGGSISAAGLYTAPATVPSPAIVHVRATSVANTTKFANAVVTVTTPAPTRPVINAFTASPASITAGGSSTLSWDVTGATSLSINQKVGIVTGTSTSVSPTATTIYTLTATNAVGNTTATATVTVTIAVPSISVTVSPTTVTLAPNTTQQFTAIVTGGTMMTPLTPVTWSVNGGGTGNGPGGSINLIGFYTAGATPGTSYVRATSKEDPTKFAEAIVTISNGGTCTLKGDITCDGKVDTQDLLALRTYLVGDALPAGYNIANGLLICKLGKTVPDTDDLLELRYFLVNDTWSSTSCSAIQSINDGYSCNNAGPNGMPSCPTTLNCVQGVVSPLISGCYSSLDQLICSGRQCGSRNTNRNGLQMTLCLDIPDNIVTTCLACEAKYPNDPLKCAYYK